MKESECAQTVVTFSALTVPCLLSSHYPQREDKARIREQHRIVTVRLEGVDQ